MPPLTQQEIAYLNSVSPMMRQQYLDAKAAQMGRQQQQIQQQQPQQQNPLQGILGGGGGQQVQQQVAQPQGQNLWQSIFGGGGGSAAATEGASGLSGLSGAMGGGSEVAASGFGEGLGTAMQGGSEVAANGFGEGLGAAMQGGGEAAAADGGMMATMGGALPLAGLAGMGAYMYNRGDSLLRHSVDEQGDMKGSMNTAWKEATKKPANALLAFNPVTGPAYWGLAAYNGLKHVSPETLQRRRAQSAASGVEGGEDWYNNTLEGNPDQKKAWQDASAAQAADFIGLDNNGTWVNNKFANSRSEADLRPEDIWQSAQMLETFGNDWNSGKYTDKRREVAQALLDNNLIDERKGGIYFQKGQEDRAKEIADQVIASSMTRPQLNVPQQNISSTFNGVLKSSSPAVPIQKNQGLKAGDAGYDWNYARAQKKGQARW